MTKEKLITKDYESPKCEVVLMNTQQVLCASGQTENVEDTDGEW